MRSGVGSPFMSGELGVALCAFLLCPPGVRVAANTPLFFALRGRKSGYGGGAASLASSTPAATRTGGGRLRDLRTLVWTSRTNLA